MAFQFTPARSRPYSPGDLFLGLDPHTFLEVGLGTDRHAITVAGARSGKGAALIIPNLLRWPEAVLNIDPKGENAEASAEAREQMGQVVGVIDPFHVANIPDRLRVSINPLASIDPASLTVRADIEVIADGLVKRSDPKHAEWDDGATALLAGVIAYVVGDAPPEHRNLTAVRRVLLQPKEALYEDAQRMTATDAGGGLARSAGITIMTALESEKGMEKDFLSGARRHSSWIDDPAFAAVLDRSSFDLAALKGGRASLYLVLPPDYLATKGAFLRLFVRCALSAMSKARHGGRCLFLLDEFYSLGRLDEIATAAGLMPGYGVHLWPFLQDLGQLITLYGPQGAQTFFGNSDAQIFFGNTDPNTLEWVSLRLGVLTLSETGAKPQEAPAPVPDLWRGGIDHQLTAQRRAHYETLQNDYSHRLRQMGSPRLTAQEIRALVSKPDGDKVARSMIVFGKGDTVLNLQLAPYFLPSPVVQPPPPKPLPPPRMGDYVSGAGVWFVGGLMYFGALASLRDFGSGLVAVGAVVSFIIGLYIASIRFNLAREDGPPWKRDALFVARMVDTKTIIVMLAPPLLLFLGGNGILKLNGIGLLGALVMSAGLFVYLFFGAWEKAQAWADEYVSSEARN